MPQSARTFRIFVSSTFSDLKAERNVLQEKVFPRLRDLAVAHGCRFQAIDLRWGVSEEAVLDQQTMNICLGEIARCQKTSPRPNFIVMLGDRYGWCPPPSQIPSSDFNKILDVIETMNDQAFLLDWYRLDENAVPPEWRLTPRLKGDKYEKYENWQPVESRLHDILAAAAEKLNFTPEQQLPYIASATEQEVAAGALHVKEAPEHVFCFFRSIEGLPQQFNPSEFLTMVKERLKQEYPDGLSQSSQELMNKIMETGSDSSAKGYADRIKDVLNHTPNATSDEEALNVIWQVLVDATAKDFLNLDEKKWTVNKSSHEKQQDLKDRLQAYVPGHIFSYQARWTGEGITTDRIGTIPDELAECLPMLEDDFSARNLCEAVWHSLGHIIKKEIEQSNKTIPIEEAKPHLQPVDPLEAEIAAHEIFGRERARIFIGRRDILNAIEKYIKGDNLHPLAIWGESGCGKSALMAKAVEQTQQNGQDVLYRFIGATPESSNGRALLESLCRQISRRYGADDSTIPSEYKDLVQELPKRLTLARADKALIIFLDALDQLSDSDNARNLIWLSSNLPANMHLIVSTLPGECLKALESKLPAQNLLEVQPMPLEDGQAILKTWLKGIRRRLQENQERYLLGKFMHCGLPLYLKLAFEEARLWKSYDSLPELSNDIPGILDDLFKRLSLESNHGQMLVSRSLGYLAAAKNGLSEDELLDVLSLDKEMLADFQRRSPKSPKSDRLPVVVWSRLYFDLEPYLNERSADGISLLAFYHTTTFKTAVMDAYLSGEEGLKRHQALSEYFYVQDNFYESQEDQRKRAETFPPTPRPANIRKVDELPYHLLEVARHVDLESNKPEAKEWNIVADLLTDWQFLEAKAEAQPTMIPDLVQDLADTIDRMPEEHPKRYILALLEEAVRRDRQFIDRHPTTLFQCLWNSCWWYDSPSLESYMSELSARLHDLELTNRSARGELGYLLMENWLQNKTPNTVWVKSLRPPSIPLGDRASNSLRGPKDEVWSVAASPDGRTIVGGVKDGSIFIWDIPSGRLRLSFKAHQTINKNGIRKIEFLSDGQSFASHAEDGMSFWDATSGFPLSQEDGRVSSYCEKCFAAFAQTEAFEDCLRSEFRGFYQLLAISPDERYAAIANDNQTIQIIDTANHEEVGRFQLDTSPCSAVFSQDSKILAAVSEDGEHVLWNVLTRNLEDRLQIYYHSNEIVRRMRFSPDGQRLAVLFNNSTAVDILCVPSMNNAGSRFLAHRSMVTSVDFLPGDDHQVVSGSFDRSVMVWNSDDFHRTMAIEGHSSTIRNIVFSTDGKRIITSAKDGTLVWDAESGRLILGGDEPSAKGSTNGLVAWSDTLETTIDEPLHSVKVAWFPTSLSNLTSHPSRRIWAGSQLNDLYILELIGDFDTAGLGHTANASRPVGLLFKFDDFRDIGGAIADLEKAGYIGRRKLQFTLVVKATGTGELPAISEALGRFQRYCRFLETCSWDD
jgi:WD40 repeat protein